MFFFFSRRGNKSNKCRNQGASKDRYLLIEPGPKVNRTSPEARARRRCRSNSARGLSQRHLSLNFTKTREEVTRKVHEFSSSSCLYSSSEYIALNYKVCKELCMPYSSFRKEYKSTTKKKNAAVCAHLNSLILFAFGAHECVQADERVALAR